MSYDMKKLLALSEGILAGTTNVKEVALSRQQDNPSSPARPVIDVKDVEVPDTYVQSILSLAKVLPLNEQQDKAPLQEDSLSEAQRLEEKMQSLVERLLELIREAKGVMTEMNSTGNFSFGEGKKLMFKRQNGAYPPKAAKPFKVKKNGSTKINK
tara:strand:- start:2970 stop:3434 length:465 start_codon:yes stop_codon:yes gene_type:complete